MTSSAPLGTDFHEFGSRVQRLPSRDSGTKSKSCRRSTLTLLLLLALALPALGACGRKGPPEPPEGSTYPRQYPNPAYQ